MSLNPREEQILDSIKDKITRSDPGLTALLATFTKLVAEENMPARENIQASRRTSRRPRRKRRRSRHISRRTISRAHQRFGYQRLGLLLWLVISIALVTTALALNRGGGGTGCTPALTVTCTNPGPAQSSPDSPPKAGPGHGSPG